MKKKFNEIFKPSFSKVFLIAEVSGNHQNSYKSLKKLISSLVNQQPDAIKFQVYKPNTITINSKKKDFQVEKKSPWSSTKYMYDLYEKAHTPWKWISKLTKHLNKINFPWFASIFDEKSLMFMEDLNCPVYKIASPEITDINLIRITAKTKKPIILSTGVSNFEDINLAIKTIRKYHNKIIILKCVSEYPAKYEDLNLKDILFFKKKYKLSVGFSDHTIGNQAATLASYLGATVFEKHFKIDDDKKSIDSHFSMNISELKKYKESILIGKQLSKENKKKNMNSKYILKKKQISNRSLYICKNIKKNQILTKEFIQSVRPGYSLHPKHLSKILGKKVNKNLSIGSRIHLVDFL